MNDKISSLIPKARVAIKKYMVNNDNKVSSEFKGYISSFGASVIQSGLLPSLSFYTDVSKVKGEATPGQKRNKMLKALLYIISDIGNDPLLFYVMEEACDIANRDNVRMASRSIPYSAFNKDKLDLLEDEIMDAAIALKLALRTFIIDDSK